MILTYRYRVKDATIGPHLQRMSWAVNQVWNYCNEMSSLAWRREKRFLSGYALITLCKGAGHDLGLHSDTISLICQQYASQRTYRKKIRLKWRSKKRSLGWIPFQNRAINLGTGVVVLKGHHIRFWQSRPVEGIIKTGTLSQDSRRHWYVNFYCEVDTPAMHLNDAEIGIDLGLRDQVACSDGVKYSRKNLTQVHASALAMAQRAHKKKRVRAIYAAMAHQRRDWAHKTSTAVVRRSCLIVIGNVSPSQLAKTRMAKSVFDAGWSQLRMMLAYKAIRLGVSYCEVNESWSTVTCSGCGSRCGPSGLSTLGVREWCCSACGVWHDRDINAAHNILRVGRHTLTGSP